MREALRRQVSLSSSSHLAPNSGFKIGQASDIPARAREAGDKAGADRIGDECQDDRDARAAFSGSPRAGPSG